MAEKVKIALCLEYPLALRGGVSVLVETLLQGLSGHYELALVSPDSLEDISASSVASLIQHHFIWNPLVPSRKSAQILAEQLATADVQIAHFHFGGNFGWGNRFIGRCPIPYSAKKGIQTLSTVHSLHGLLDGFCGPQKPLWFKLALFPVAYAGKFHVLHHLKREITVSQSNFQTLRQSLCPFKNRFLHIYHSRLKEDSYSVSAKPREKVILNVGHIARVKGQELLAAAFAQIAPRYPDWKLWFVGDAPEKDVMQRIDNLARVHRLEDRIRFFGRREDAADFMKRAAIYVQPSRSEALGLALQEAMFYGCAVLGTNVGGIPEIIEHKKSGLLVDAGNASQLAEAIETLIKNPELRENYSCAGAASIVQKGMTFEQMIANHIRLYESILRNS
jgi:glycosyltransferase involved in cell wall biosynthesis